MSNFNLGNQNISEWHKDVVKSVPALPAPSAALAGFRRFRTSDNTEFICDGVRWLSTTVYKSAVEFVYVSGTVSANPHMITATTYMTANLPSGVSLFPIEMRLRLFQTAAGSVANYYRFDTFGSSLFGWTNGGTDPARNTQTIPANVWTQYLWLQSNGSFPTAPLTLSADPAQMQAVLVGVPGTLIMVGLFKYREVG